MTYSVEQLELKAHIVAENEKQALKGNPFRTVECLDHWADYGVFNIAQYERHFLVADVWDLYKDVHGIRPRFINFDDMSNEAIGEMYDSLLEELQVVNAREAEREAENIAKFEQKVIELIGMGAGERNTAIRWLLDGSGNDNDMGYACYTMGLPYSYADQFSAAFAEVEAA